MSMDRSSPPPPTEEQSKYQMEAVQLKVLDAIPTQKLRHIGSNIM